MAILNDDRVEGEGVKDKQSIFPALLSDTILLYQQDYMTFLLAQDLAV